MEGKKTETQKVLQGILSLWPSLSLVLPSLAGPDASGCDKAVSRGRKRLPKLRKGDFEFKGTEVLFDA